ncbi:YegP family protein, partial [Erwinia sp. V71]|uniref:YegP family protein n=1 Tax=Erwinia sp. V71 TaxID=3369424 RepID=UPI003F60F40B
QDSLSVANRPSIHMTKRCTYYLNSRNTMNDKWEFYKDGSDKWRWRRKASNGNIVGASSQGYVNKADCIENAKRNGYKG